MVMLPSLLLDTRFPYTLLSHLLASRLVPLGLALCLANTNLCSSNGYHPLKLLLLLLSFFSNLLLL